MVNLFTFNDLALLKVLQIYYTYTKDQILKTLQLAFITTVKVTIRNFSDNSNVIKLYINLINYH